jgi:hypothetical protein
MIIILADGHEYRRTEFSVLLNIRCELRIRRSGERVSNRQSGQVLLVVESRIIKED